ncbi:hypothetical protein LX87_04545 [Larkinella arboricola]|uniref:Uncharacterized protein n=1 Tax=Larkinella arboricola TaxID=643671 RepID=A0A327WLZ0_LARAB|nr:hypothetical protein LX87_04545 [Larkinella arboricola]
MPLELTIIQQIEEQYRLLVESVQDYDIFYLIGTVISKPGIIEPTELKVTPRLRF